MGDYAAKWRADIRRETWKPLVHLTEPQSKIKNFQERLKSDEPILYDGGFGSQLFARDIELANSALANKLHPAAVVDIHSDYINVQVPRQLGQIRLWHRHFT